jgi:hypothetical protein
VCFGRRAKPGNYLTNSIDLLEKGKGKRKKSKWLNLFHGGGIPATSGEEKKNGPAFLFDQ